MVRRLIYAMKKLDITERYLGEMLSVDKSLVNKWKNDKRKFDIHSPYFGEVVGILANVLDTVDPHIKEEFLNSLPVNPIVKNSKEFFEWFFLTDEITDDFLEKREVPENLKNSLIWSGCENIIKAYRAFFDRTKEQKDGVLRVYFSVFEKCEQDKEAVEYMFEEFRKVASRNNTIEFIFESREDDLAIRFLINFLSVNFLEGFRLYIKKKNDNPNILQNYMVFEKTAAIQINVIKDNKGQYVEIFTDSERCDFFFNRFKTDREGSNLLVKKIRAKNTVRMFAETMKFSENKGMSYIYSHFPPFFFISEELVGGILDSNGVEGEEKRRIMIEYLMVKNSFLKDISYNIEREIYSMEGFDRLLTDASFRREILWSISNKQINISNSQLSKIFLEWKAYILNNKNIEIKISPRPLLPVNISWGCYVKCYYFAMIWKDYEYVTNNLYTEDAYNSQLLYRTVDGLWESESLIIDTKEKVAKYIDSLVELLNNAIA